MINSGRMVSLPADKASTVLRLLTHYVLVLLGVYSFFVVSLVKFIDLLLDGTF
jgi:hypothetical protein